VTIALTGPALKKHEGLLAGAGKKIVAQAKLILGLSESQQTLCMVTVRIIMRTSVKAEVMTCLRKIKESHQNLTN